MYLRATLFALALAGVSATACSVDTAQDISQKSQEATLCGQFEYIDVLNGEYVINNNVWNGDGQCIEASSNSTAFTVTQADHNLTTAGPPASYPSIFKGCHWGNCTSNSGLPIQVSALPTINSSWDITASGGAWDAAYDIWFDTSPNPSGQPNHVELMIWIDHEGGPQPFGSMKGTVNIEGASWEVWEGPMDGWRYIAYRRTNGTQSVSDLNLTAFAEDSVNRGWLDPSAYMVTIEAGFEIWQGGQGLKQNSFSATVGSDGGSDGGGSDGGGSDGGGSDDGGDTGGTCEATYEAENMTATTGGSISSGWNLWSNGSLSTSHDFVSGGGTVTVVAKGDQAGSQAPHMVVSVGGQVIGDAYVSATSWTSYSFDYSNNSGGVQGLSVAFDNDYYNSSTGEDRNLHVDKVSVACGGSGDGGGTTASCSDGILNQDESDVDCGGSCGDCANGDSCSTNGDCSSGNCSSGTCQAVASCTDGVRNGDETDVDCGGSCGDCANGDSCSTNSDCSSGNCSSGTCQTADTGGDTGGTGDVTGSLVITNNWTDGYCADLTVSSSANISTWTVELDTNQSAIYNTWNANFGGNAPNYTVTPLSWNASISTGGSVTVGFCANKTGGSWQPEVTSAGGN